jgi:gas vesicle protein
MRTLIGWTMGAACATVIVTGLSALPAPAQETKNDRREIRQDSREIRGDRKEIAKDTKEIRGDQKELQASRQQLREAYRSGDPAAIKAAREKYQKSRGGLRSDLKDRRQDVRDLHQDKQDRREDVRDLHQDRRQARTRQAK